MENENDTLRGSQVFGDPHVHVYIATVLVIAGFVIIFFMQTTRLLPLIVMAGMGGGVISTYLRVRGSSGYSDYQGAHIVPRLQAYISPLVAGMLALVFHGFMAAEVVTGALFPEFKNSGLEFSSVEAFLKGLSPATNGDAAKAVVWAFVAGFSERLVPNVLDTIAKTDTGR